MGGMDGNRAPGRMRTGAFRPPAPASGGRGGDHRGGDDTGDDTGEGMTRQRDGEMTT